jgi:hypothetical protein
MSTGAQMLGASPDLIGVQVHIEASRDEQQNIIMLSGFPGVTTIQGQRGVRGLKGNTVTGPTGSAGPTGPSITGPTGADSTAPGPTGPSITGPTGSIELYTNTGSMPEDVGGWAAGSTFSGVSFQQMMDGLLYPYQTPSFSAFSIAGQALTLECGINITSGNKTFIWTTVNSTNVEANSLIIRDVTNSVDLATGCADDASQVVNFPTALTRTVHAQYRQWSLSGTDSNDDVITAKVTTITWYSPYFYGVGPAGLSANSPANILDLEQMTKGVAAKGNKTGIYTNTGANDTLYYAYPKSWGLLASIIDENGFNITSAFHSPTSLAFTNSPGNYEGVTTDYYVYESIDPSSVTAYDITFNF